MRLLTEYHYVIFRIMPYGMIHIHTWQSSLENFNLCNYCALRQQDVPEYSLVSFAQ
jgi:hypothetical protein